MAQIAEYRDRYETAALRRDENGILEVTLGWRGGSLVWNEACHRELPDLFHDIGSDAENRIVILTGRGESFLADYDMRSLGADHRRHGWDKTYWEGKQLLQNLLNIEVPVIAAVNGPAHIHAEIALLADIVLASEAATFQDLPHFRSGVVPGDGVHILWPLLLGPNRGRYFLLTGEILSAHDARALGVVGEVLEPGELLPRAWELARAMAAKSTLTLRYTRVALTQSLKRAMLDGLGYGLILEGAALYPNVPPQAPAS
jgi:enoyl-CoA hydratase/carnithine racemase